MSPVRFLFSSRFYGGFNTHYPPKRSFLPGPAHRWCESNESLYTSISISRRRFRDDALLVLPTFIRANTFLVLAYAINVPVDRRPSVFCRY